MTRSNLLVLFVIATTVQAVFAQPFWVESVSVTEPRAGVGAVHLSGIWIDTCVPDTISHTVDGGRIDLEVTVPNLNTGCGDALTPWALSEEFQLPVGNADSYSIYGNLVAVDPANRSIRDPLSGPDLLFRLPTQQQAIFHSLGNIGGDEYVSAASDVSADGSVVVGHNHVAPHVAALKVSEAFAWSPSTGMFPLGILPGGIPGGSRALGVSADGNAVVGDSTAQSDPRGFRWSLGGGLEELTSPEQSPYHTSAIAVSRHGNFVAGTFEFFPPGPPFFDGRSAVRWNEDGVIQHLGALPHGGASWSADISKDGQTVVGNSSPQFIEGQQNEDFEQTLTEPFVWNPDDGMQGIGHYYFPILNVIDVGGPIYFHTVAHGVSSTGEFVVGSSEFSIADPNVELEPRVIPEPFEKIPFLWSTDTEFIDLSDDHVSGLISGTAVDVSSDGSIVVGNGLFASLVENDPRDEKEVPFIWDPEKGLRRLERFLSLERGLGTTGDLEGWDLGQVTAISDDGTTIVGTGVNPSGMKEAWRIVLSHNLTPGDANLDGVFNSTDLVAVFKVSEYEDQIDKNSSWTSGDWNGDFEFDSSDLVTAFQYGAYEETAAIAVPEPSSMWIFGPIVFWVFLRFR